MTTSHSSYTIAKRNHGGAALNFEEANSVFWREIKRILLEFQQNQAASAPQAEYLVKLMVALHRDLEAVPSFLFALHHANTEARGDGAWSKRLLLQDDDMYLQLVTYFADHATPIHDHPDLSSINLPLSGRLSIEYYATGHAALESTYPIAKLRRTETHTYGTYEASMCFPWQKNIQEIRAISERCVVLSAGLKPQSQPENSWYLPISPQNTDNFFVQRLKRNE